MTNSPTYDEQLDLLKQYDGLGGKKPLPGTAEAEDRFARGAYCLTQLPKNPDSYQEAVAGMLSVSWIARTWCCTRCSNWQPVWITALSPSS